MDSATRTPLGSSQLTEREADHSPDNKIAGSLAHRFAVVATALLATLAVLLGGTGAAQAAGSWSGSSSTVNLYNYNFYQTGFTGGGYSSAPAGSTITGVSYDLNYMNSGFASGSLQGLLCSSSSNCVSISTGYGNVTSFFNGLPANSTDVYFRVRWTHPYLTGSIKNGPIKVDIMRVNVSYS